jgi:FdhD protein
MKPAAVELAPVPEASLAPGHRTHAVLRADKHGSRRPETDQLAREFPVAFEFNGISHATVLATPDDLEDLAYGFSFTEGIIRSATDIYDLDVIEQERGMVVQMHIASACLQQLKLRRRSLAGRTGCGLCGIESLDEVRRVLPPVTVRTIAISPLAISSAVHALRARQPLHLITGATHGAGWATVDGEIVAVREDVGRHNALDKLIGHLLREEVDTSNGIAVISSRASFEMVQKAASAGMSALVAVSAPTTYAVEIAEELNVLLAGFARDNSFTVYTHTEHMDNGD